MRFITKFKVRIYAAVSLCAVLLVMTSCKEQVETTLLESVSVQEKDYLTFNSFESFKEAYEKMGNQSPLEQKTYDDAHGVTSLRQLYQQVVAEEAANYEQEEKQYVANPKTEPTHKPSATLAKVTRMVLRDEENGGVVLNLFIPKMAAVLNKDGVVCIDKSLYQFTYGATKSIPLTNATDLSKTVSLLYSTAKTNQENQIYVGEVKHTQHPIYVPNARRDFHENFSCEAFNASTPAGWRMICYLDEVEYTIVRNNNPWGITETVRGGAINANVRTLKRGSFGSWYDRDSQEQRFGSTNFAFRSGSILGSPERAYTDLPGGTTEMYTIAANNYSKSFLLQPPNQTASFQVTMFSNEYSDFAGPRGNPSYNMRSAPGVVYNATWSPFGCACNITRPL